MPWQNDACLLLNRDFGVSADNLLEADIHTIEEVTAAAQAAEAFCRAHGQNDRISNHIALCIEEMAGNPVLHGFGRDGSRNNHLSIRVLHKPDHWVLRFRDDCSAFDPVQYVPAEGKDALGIRLVLAMADEVRYTYSLNLNNLALKLAKTR